MTLQVHPSWQIYDICDHDKLIFCLHLRFSISDVYRALSVLFSVEILIYPLSEGFASTYYTWLYFSLEVVISSQAFYNKILSISVTNLFVVYKPQKSKIR